MTKLLTDEKLTAYLLDELDDLQRRAVEDALKEDAQARQTLAELRAASQLVMEAFEVQPEVSLTEEQRQVIHKSAREPAAAGNPSRRTNWARWSAVAALVLLLGGGFVLVNVTGSLSPSDSSLPSNLDDVRFAGLDRNEDPLAPRDEAREKIDRQLQEQQDRILYQPTEDGVADILADSPAFLDGSASPMAGQAQGIVGETASPPTIHDPYPADQSPGTEDYNPITDNAFMFAAADPLSTLSIDVDTASYANIRRFLRSGRLPPKDSVRIEEMLNYFSYDYPQPTGNQPFATHVELAGCPWNSEHRLARIGIQGRDMAPSRRPATNLVFLLDVSGSMSSDNKLPLLKQAMKLLLMELDERDQVSIVVYAGASGLVLPSTPCNESATIFAALDNLDAGGSTNGGAGIQLAYDTASDAFIKGGVNRVILATDGDFNVGITGRGDLVELIEEQAASDIFLTVLGFGIGNLKDATMEQLADKGNGNYAYIDTINEAQKVLVDELTATLVTIAKDVKIQVEFNPAQVLAYRLIGYENRILAARDFNDDTRDAGEIGAGHSVTALYEIVPVGAPAPPSAVDPLKYQRTPELSTAAGSDELMTIKLRYKQPTGTRSQLLSHPVKDGGRSYAQASTDFKFAAAVAAFGMLLRDSPHKGTASYDGVLELAGEGTGEDHYGYREEFVEIVDKARSLAAR